MIKNLIIFKICNCEILRTLFYLELGRIGLGPRENCSIGLRGKCYNIHRCVWMAKSLERGEVLWCWGRLHRNARRPILKQIFTLRFIDGYQERDVKLFRMIFEIKIKKFWCHLGNRVYRDLLILADESTSIGVANFQHVKRTLALMIQNLCGGISLDTNRVAMLRYSSDIKVDFDFYGGIHEPKVNFNYCERSLKILI